MAENTETDRDPFELVAREKAVERLENLFFLAFQDLDEIEKLNGTKILDLGCGSFESPDSKEYDKLTPTLIGPWVVKIAGERGAIAVGIDLGPQAKEDLSVYHHIQANLIDLLNPSANLVMALREKINENPLSFFDVINVKFLIHGDYGSRTLIKLFDPVSERRNLSEEAREKMENFKNWIFRAAEILLRDRGILALEDEIWILVDGQLIRFEEFDEG